MATQKTKVIVWRAPKSSSKSSSRLRGVTGNHPVTTCIPLPDHMSKKLTASVIKDSLRLLGITESVVIHEQDYHQFLQEKGIQELGRGAEGAVYFLRGHVVKVVNRESAPAALREIAHMLHLNYTTRANETIGERARSDWPSLLWVYALSNGGISVGMKPFDLGECATPGVTLYERLNFGPHLPRAQTLRAMRSICRSLVYARNKGIVHHDLKPANIYVPTDPAQDPVVFDLGQALWQQAAWGRGWLRHKHNLHYWYNGTYRYMHHLRRLAHGAAVALSEREKPNTRQQLAFEHYMPSFYDDVFSFARILRDIVRSRFVQLAAADRTALREFYWKLMGLQHSDDRDALTDSGLFRRIQNAFRTTSGVMDSAAALNPRWGSMDQVLPELEHTLMTLAVPQIPHPSIKGAVRK